MILACAGNARVGKNLFASLLKEELKLRGIESEIHAIATELKEEVYLFLFDNFKLNSFSEDPRQKDKFRDLLVWYANLKRRETDGRYWIDKLAPRLLENKNRKILSIITDLRFINELFWVKNDLEGLVIYIDKTKDGILTPPANIHEKENNEVLKLNCDFYLNWEDSGGDYNKLNFFINDFCGWFENKIDDYKIYIR